MNARTLLRPLLALIGEGHRGQLEYLLWPKLKDSWGGPFNGQQYRRRIFFDLIHHLRLDAIVETGTFRGTTTALFAETSLPVYTVEASPRYYAYARLRFRKHRGHVHVQMGDSASYLHRLAADSAVPKNNVFFYLDAHWEEHLPLRQEVEIIFANWRGAVVMIDDFQVPDTTYAFDDYGPGKALDLSYLEAVIVRLGLHVFFPAVGPSQETGSKRGAVVLCREQGTVDIVGGISTLRRYAGYP
jgi:hypothetical protein